MAIRTGALDRRIVTFASSLNGASEHPSKRLGQGTELIVYVSPMLEKHGFAHGFSTRHGGVSSVPFCSLNLGLCSGFVEPSESHDSSPNESVRIETNTRRFLGACGIGDRRVARVRQVHGDAVAEAEDVASLAQPVEADAVVARTRGLAAMIRTADCVPVLVGSVRTGAVVAIHAGWRGLVAGVIESAIARLKLLGASEEDLVAAIGPSIGAASYEVGDEVAGRFVERGLSECVRTGRQRAHVDCHHAAHALLMRSGLEHGRIDGEPLCTFTNADDFFSARRDGPISGRLAAVIAPST